MSNQQHESELLTRLSEIEAKLQQLSQLSTLSERVARLEEKLEQNPAQLSQPSGDISERVSRLEDQLIMVSDVDRYGKLRDLLAAGNFKEADRETTRVLLEVATKDRDSLTPEDIRKFPCSVLRIIDRLWLTYSKERFGFSVQARIYRDQGGTLDTLVAQDIKVIESLAERVGWLKNKKEQFSNYDNWDFTLEAPVGCFPANWWWPSPYGLKMVNFHFTRLFACEL